MLAVAATACVVVMGRRVRARRSARRRGAALFGERAVASRGGRRRQWPGRGGVARGGRLPVVAAGAGGVACVAFTVGVSGCVVTLVATAYVLWRRRRKTARAEGEVTAEEAATQLPLAADLLAACLAAGASPREAAEAVGGSLGGPVGERLAQAAAEVRLGGEPATAWGRLGSVPGAAGLARCLERAQATGVPAVEPMSRLAERLRAEQGRAAAIRARRAGVLATAPLGLCFLPAFLTVGVVPVVIGLASGLMRGTGP
nr:type II secretion system F family protein [Streptomyces cinnamoneus]